MIAVSALIEDLAAAVHLPAPALRTAMEHPEAIADATLPLLNAMAAGQDLDAEQANLIFWGLHVMAGARDTRALSPLLAILRQDIEIVDAVLGDAVTATLSRVLASLYDDQEGPLFRLILDSSLDGEIRGAALAACAFLCFKGRIERVALHQLLVRFDDAKAAVEGEYVWIAWEETIAYLGMRDLVPRVEAARADGRIEAEFSDPDWFADALRAAERFPDEEDRLSPELHGYLDDPVTALEWTREGYGEPQRNPFRDVGRNDPCPCGSGMKFKKCCLGKVEVEAPWMPPAR